MEVRLLLASCQRKVHLKMTTYNESDDDDVDDDEDDDAHSEEEISPAGVEVNWQLYQ